MRGLKDFGRGDTKLEFGRPMFFGSWDNRSESGHGQSRCLVRVGQEEMSKCHKMAREKVFKNVRFIKEGLG